MTDAVLITGAASGIGLETARQLAAEHPVIGVDLKHAPSDLRLHDFVEADLSTREGIDEMLSKVPSRLRGVVNVAGVGSTFPWLLQFRLNFLAPRYIIEQTRPRLDPTGSAVTVASATAYRWRETIATWSPLTQTNSYEAGLSWLESHPQEERSYTRSKEAISVWTAQAGARWAGSGQRVNAISPGPVDTAMMADARKVVGNDRIDSDIARSGRAGTPRDVAPVIAFLLTDAAAWICGETISVDGGFTASMLTAP